MPSSATLSAQALPPSERVPVPPTLPPLAPPPASGDELGAAGRRSLIGGVLLAHVLGGWALMQVDAVRQAVVQVAPVLMVDMIAPPPPPERAPPPPPAPRPKVVAPAPPPLIAAAPTLSPAPPAFVIPEPVPAPPTPLVSPPVPPAPPAPPAVAAAPAPLKIPGSAIRYLAEPRLNFPLLSKRANESGMVVLRITVDVNGRLKDAAVQRSSGFPRLDQAALQDIRSARFVPHMDDGKPVEIETLARLDYVLDR